MIYCWISSRLFTPLAIAVKLARLLELKCQDLWYPKLDHWGREGKLHLAFQVWYLDWWFWISYLKLPSQHHELWNTWSRYQQLYQFLIQIHSHPSLHSTQMWDLYLEIVQADLPVLMVLSSNLIWTKEFSWHYCSWSVRQADFQHSQLYFYLCIY